jgi:hypothetical protein
MGGCKVGIEFDCLVEQSQRIVIGLAAPLVEARHRAQEVVIGVEACWLALGALDFGLLQLRRDRADDGRGDPILQLENVLDLAVEAIGRNVRAGRCIDELRRDAHTVGRFAHAAFKNIAHAELAPDLLYVHCAALVGEARIAGDDEQPAHARERADNVFHHPVGEIVLRRIAAHVLKRQDSDRWLVGGEQPPPRALGRLQ